ncbi:TPR repeat-containing protein YfgC precursor [compost metagenome]
MKKTLLATTLTLATLGSAGCAQLLTGGLTAAQALQPISEAQEIEIGRSAAQEVLNDSKTRLYTHSSVNAYVREVGMRMASRSERPGLPWEFRIVEDAALNAFALPGGQIFITTGALSAMKNEAELAGVLGHEVAHVAHKHGIEKLKQAMIAQGIATATLGSTPQLAQQAGAIALTLVLNGQGRGAELEADRYGTLYEARENYNPQALGDFLRTIDTTSGGTPAWLGVLSTHPSLNERLETIRQTIEQHKLSGNLTKESEYLTSTSPLR